MSFVKKDEKVSYTPGSPGVPATPGSPAHPAYDVTTTVSVPSYTTSSAPSQPAGNYVYFPPDPLVPGSQGHYGFVPNNGNGGQIVSGSDGSVITSITYHNVTTTTHYPASSGTDPTPGIPATQPQLVIQQNLGWNSGAISIHAFTGNKAFDFHVAGDAVGVVIGLNDNDTGEGYKEINYAFYCHTGLFNIMEGGASVTGQFTFSNTDTLKIQRRGTTVSYWKNSTLIYTSLIQSSGNLIADSSLYSGNDYIIDAAFTDIIFGDNISENSRAPRQAFSGATGSSKSIQSRLARTVISNGYQNVTSNNYRLPRSSVSANYDYSYSINQRAVRTIESSQGELSPDYSICNVVRAYRTSYAHVLTGGIGSSNASRKARKVFSANYQYAQSTSERQPRTVSVPYYPDITAFSFLEFPMPEINAFGFGLPTNSFYGEFQMPELVAYAGGYSKLEFPFPELSITAVTWIIGTAELEFPMPEMESEGISGGVGQAILESPFVEITAYGGGFSALEFPMPEVSAEGVIGGVGIANLEFPMPELLATGISVSFGTAFMEFPMPEVVSGGFAFLEFPMPTIGAVGHQVVEAEYEAYCINLQAEDYPVTRYTNYPFNQIIRFGQHYYGVANDGLYLIGGDKDVNQPIAWKFRTCISDFGIKNLKRMRSVYVGCRLENEIDLTVGVGEEKDKDYRYRMVRGEGIKTSRVKIGKGMKSRYWAFGMADPTGGFIELDSIDIEMDDLERIT